MWFGGLSSSIAGPMSRLMSYNKVDGIITETRDISPSHYMIKIENFPFFEKNKMEKYETGEFEAGKYLGQKKEEGMCKWKLIIYPKGDPLRNGEDHLSLFLRIVPDANSWKVGSGEACAIVKFFVYNQISNAYHTVQGKARRFHAPNPEWGVSRFLRLETFNDPSEGYLVNGACIFGVEVFVIEGPTKRECITLKPPSSVKYPWKINKFSTIGNSLASRTFHVGNYAWAIWLFPRGDGKGKDHSISVFLFLSNYNILSPDQKVHAEFTISLTGLGDLTPKSRDIHIREGGPTPNRQASPTERRDSTISGHTATHLFSAASTHWGWPLFLPLKTIEDNIINDSFTLEAEVSIIGEVDKFL